jgi:hypothetical protein
MTTRYSIKKLTHSAISLLEAIYCSRGLVPRPRASPATARPTLTAQVHEMHALCQSAEGTAALLLSSAVAHLALERKNPTLLVTARHSLPVIVANLLLFRAGISLEQALNPPWCDKQFTRLCAACRDVAGAPLIVVRSMHPVALKDTILAAVANCRRTWVVMDTAIQPLDSLKPIGFRYRAPIIIISSGGGQKLPPASSNN